MPNVLVLLIVFAAMLIMAVLLIVWYTLRRVVNNYVKPHLAEAGCTLISYTWTTSPVLDNFNDDNTPANQAVSPGSYWYLYLNVIYLKGAEQKKATVRIKTFLLMIASVDYNTKLGL